MPHIHEKIDFCVGAYIVQDNKVLLINHKKLASWLCPGGHVELDEDPETALHREIMEETGLKIKLLGHTPVIANAAPVARPMTAPDFLDIHKITDTHQHIGMFWIAVPMAGSQVDSNAEYQGGNLRWFSFDELAAVNCFPASIYYARSAILALQKNTPDGAALVMQRAYGSRWSENADNLALYYWIMQAIDGARRMERNRCANIAWRMQQNLPVASWDIGNVIADPLGDERNLS